MLASDSRAAPAGTTGLGSAGGTVAGRYPVANPLGRGRSRLPCGLRHLNPSLVGAEDPRDREPDASHRSDRPRTVRVLVGEMPSTPRWARLDSSRRSTGYEPVS